MRDFNSRVIVAARSSLVWQVLADIDRWADWTPTVRRIEHLDDLPMGVGSRISIEQPKLWPATWTVTQWEPGVGLSWSSRSRGLTVTALHAVEVEANSTRVKLEIQFAGFLAPIASVLASRLTRRYLGLEAAGLKARCEGAS